MLEPTTSLLTKYNPELTCLLVGREMTLGQRCFYGITGGQRQVTDRLDADAAVRQRPVPTIPDNLPIVAAKGGPGGKPGCGSLPDVAKNCSRCAQLVTNTGWGTGLDIRPNPGIGLTRLRRLLPGHPRGPRTSEHSRLPAGPAPGPIPYPGAPPYGAPLYGPDGTPLYPGLHRPHHRRAGARHARRTAGGLRSAAAIRPTGIPTAATPHRSSGARTMTDR